MTNKSESSGEHEIDCVEAFDHLYAYLNDEISNKVDLANIEHHLSHCKSCYSRAQMEKKINQRIKEESEKNKDNTPESLKNRLRSLMDEI